MLYSDPTLKQGIVEDIDFWCDTDATKYSLANKARNVNRWYDRAIALILDSDGRWQFDDTNATDLPIGTATLVNNQQDYTLDTTFIKILRVEVLDVNGQWNKLLPIDQADLYSQSVTDFLKTAGMPKYYDVQGSSILLYPKPDNGVSVTLASGLKVFCQRNVSYFVAGDTTKVPGFVSLFHRYLSFGASLDWAIKKQLPQKNDLQGRVTVMEDAIRGFYSQREKDEKIQLTPKRQSFR